MTSSTIPWVEKYRPSNFEDIVLDPKNRNIFENIIEKNYFPNLLFYGPPGTGKTTTIINLINAYQSKTEQVSKTTVIHLNASDERGIDIIRNQIYQFVRSNNLFEKGVKFVILDEVDYMTKNAQQALKYLLQSSHNVRFCLICNYISKIDESLKNEFISIRFNQLPPRDIHRFIRNVAQNEKIEMTDEMIYTIQSLYYSDIRSMINFIQINQNTGNWEKTVITDALFENVLSLIRSPKLLSELDFRIYIHEVSIQYNTDKRTLINLFFNYLIRNHTGLINPILLDNIEAVVHSSETALDYTIDLLYRIQI
jgi:replication factor C subunit 3/5